MLALVFFEPETAFEVSVPGEEIESSITGDSLNIVINAALLVLGSGTRHNRLTQRCSCLCL